MGTRKSPSGPRSAVTGFVALAQTAIPAGSAAGVAVTASGILAQFIRIAGSTTVTRIDPRLLSTNDVVTGSPRATVPLGTSQIGISYMRISSIGTASAVVEMAFINPSTLAATLVANTWNLNIALQNADL